jgi:cell division protein FtsQ
VRSVARKSARRRRHGRFRLLWKLLSVVVVAAAVVLAITLFFKVNTIAVSGEGRYREEEILKASGVETGDNLFLLNKYDIANSLLTKLPYIETVRINRKLPDTLLIDVTECTSVYAMEQDGTTWLLSSGGKLVESGDASIAAEIPVLDGCKMEEPTLAKPMQLTEPHRQESLLALFAALDDASLVDQVQAIHLDSASELTMDYADRFQVRLLYGADYAYKLRNLTAVVDALETNQTGTIDLTKDGEAHFLPK